MEIKIAGIEIKAPTLRVLIRLGITAAFVILIVALVLRPRTAPEPQEQWKRIIPGVTTQEEVKSLLGEPDKTETINGQLVFYYTSTSPYFADEIFIGSDNKVEFIRERIIGRSDISLQTYLNNLGNYIRLYGPDSESSGIFLYVSPERGAAYLGNPINDLTEQIWYFQPSSIENLLQKTYFAEYSLTEILKPADGVE